MQKRELTAYDFQETKGNFRKRNEMRSEISGNAWNFLKSPKLVSSGQSENLHILRSGFRVPYKIPYW